MVAADHGRTAPAIPRGIIDSLALVGTAPQIVDAAQGLGAAGIQEIVIWPFPAQGQNTEDFMFKLAQRRAAAFRRAADAREP